jgi:hypothetical protein
MIPPQVLSALAQIPSTAAGNAPGNAGTAPQLPPVTLPNDIDMSTLTNLLRAISGTQVNEDVFGPDTPKPATAYAVDPNAPPVPEAAEPATPEAPAAPDPLYGAEVAPVPGSAPQSPPT